MITKKLLAGANLNFRGRVKVEHWRAGIKINVFIENNTVVTDGKNNIFNIMFNGTTQITAWYLGLMDNAGYSSNPVTDTMASHAGWAEWQSYSEATRQTWGAGAASSASITNAVAATFTMNANGTLRGAFVTSSNTKGGTTGVLWATVLFTNTVPVSSGDAIKVTYTCSA